mmetsp:Transcript_49650/g.93099  ORF Transcript_49650/g.93099 Transcript_49650/m.93099 type:complete len:95 (+) Transcript_49650:292-576(+)
MRNQGLTGRTQSQVWRPPKMGLTQSRQQISRPTKIWWVWCQTKLWQVSCCLAQCWPPALFYHLQLQICERLWRQKLSFPPSDPPQVSPHAVEAA